ncbi:MAG TPA: ABC transporter permease [Gemmataceae bacterium]|nr:ABC transporter permease [Gemmataceae bacterium]
MQPAAEAALPKPTPFWRKALASPLLVSGVVVVGLLFLFAAAAPLVAPYDKAIQQYPDGLDADGMPLPPSRPYPLGTDSLGRDVLMRILYGSRISLTVGLAAVLVAVAIGVVIGLYAGYYGGCADVILMRFTDIMMAVPALLLALAMAGLIQTGTHIDIPPWTSHPWKMIPFEKGIWSILLVIGVVSWTGIARVVRGQVLALKERAFVEAARAVGCSSTRILWMHILPNVLPAIIVLSAMSTAGAIALEAGLGYLGVGVPPPAPSWGTMISDGQPYFTVAPSLVLAPGVAVVLAVLGFNLLGQGLQDVLDPHHKRRA